MNKHLILGILAIMTSTKTIYADDNEDRNLSHAERNTLSKAIESIAQKISDRGDLPYVSVNDQLEMLRSLSQFELGRFLLQRGGLNGYWTNYVIKHPNQGRLTGLNSENQPFGEVERFLLDQAPTFLATQQRFEIFKREIQNRLFNGISLASIPCGLTADLLDLDVSRLSTFSIHGIDIDSESLQQSQRKAEILNLSTHCYFISKDAWSLDYSEQFDVITSNGLTIYEPDNQRIVELYRQFFKALKSNGCLITSFLTPPPSPGSESDWNLEAENREHALLQKILLSDILECKWQVFRSEELVKSQLMEAGFTEIEVFYDPAHICPTVVAKKT